ncbi:cyclic diguanosine monophosphate-binding protein [Marinobacterium zhoushanense]|uniref:Cyclic diguanosine monophosphate-binding protein n=1 Tax=Marinobacterium zhoushanense TaxID=1679163 RepID=A0ABQ1KG39_9GAMM|nr:PilZ domain-containing protein [Marinobacterium zhoushanense]GGB98636.1 cyclic diguanosine monophosphate-binding protein [Marinobacterium zhoushanense]
MTATQDERRRFSRIRFDAGCELHSAAGPAEVQLVDISLRGALIESSRPLALELQGEAELHIYLASDILIRMPGSVTHLSGTQYGFRAGDMDIESISHLRRLVELNLGDEAMLERELEALFPDAG